MRRLAWLLPALLSGCNSILDIPERSLLVEVDSGADTAFVIDTSVVDSGALPDTNVEDTSMPDTTVADSVATDSTSSDDAPVDSTMVDSTMVDSAMVDSAMPDTVMADSAMDTAMPDTRDSAAPDTADTSTPDTATDSGLTCGVAGLPCCGATPATCDTNNACSAGTCAAASGACVRSSDCTVGVCGGPVLCGGKVCFSCAAAPGTVAVGGACTDKSQCATGLCDRGRGVCTIPCANAITGDADCAALTKGTCTVSNVSIGSASGRVGFCARGCGKNADCPSGEYCRAFGNDVADRVDLVCAPPRTGATVEPFGACTTDAECKGGFCLATTSGGRCTTFCTAATDCMSPLPNCGTVNFTRPVSMTSQSARVCTP